MTPNLKDQDPSWLYGRTFQNVYFDYLPMAEKGNGQPRFVARIHFATDEPLASVQQSGPQVWAELFQHPEKYLTRDDKRVLEDLIKPIDGGAGGDRTRDPAKEMPDEARGRAFVKAFEYATHVTWAFVGKADPREPSRYNLNLARARVTPVGGYLARYVWNGYKQSQQPADYSTIAGDFAKAMGPAQYDHDQWWSDYVDPIKADDKWRATLVSNILLHLFNRSVFAGDDGLDPDDLDKEKYSTRRRVDIMLNSTYASADHDWTTDCSVMIKKREYYNAEKNEVLPAVIYPSALYDFNPNTQTSGYYNARQRFQDELRAEALDSWDSDQKNRWFADTLGAMVYGYRWLRMAQHELFRGHVPASTGMGPGHSNPGTESTARAVLCGDGFSSFESLHDNMISNDLGSFLFGGNPFDNSEGLKIARQIAHQYYVRTNAFYRVAYMKELPGTKRSDSWDYDGKATPPEEVDLWPPQNDIANVWTAVQGELNPDKWGDKEDVTPENDPFWGNGIPKVLGENASANPSDSPEGYMGGADHYEYMAYNGHFRYDHLSYMDSGQDIVKQTQQQKLANAYEKKDNTPSKPSPRSYTRTLRLAIKEAQEMLKYELGSDVYDDIYLKYHRDPYPDYTKSDEWKRWGTPWNDPYTSS